MRKEEYEKLLTNISEELDERCIDSMTFVMLNTRVASYIKLAKVGTWCKMLLNASELDFEKDIFTFSLERVCSERIRRVIDEYNFYDPVPVMSEILCRPGAFANLENSLNTFYEGAENTGIAVGNVIQELSFKVDELVTLSKTIDQQLDKLFEDVFKTMEEAQKALAPNLGELRSLFCNMYYSLLEEEKENIYADLYDELYKTNIISDPSKEPTPSDYASLLRNYLTQLSMNPLTKVIEDNFKHSKALDIRANVFMEHMEKRCQAGNDLSLFIHRFAETAALHHLVKRAVPILERPIEVKPLPDIVNEQIRENDQLNIAFREAMSKLIGFVKMTSAKTKWCHIKRVLEDEGLTDAMNDSAFGRLVENIDPELRADNVRKTLNNNPLVENVNDRDLPYYEWQQKTTAKQQCDKVAKYLESIINCLM